MPLSNRAHWDVPSGKIIPACRNANDRVALRRCLSPCGTVVAILAICSVAAPVNGQPLDYVTLDYGSAATFLTGIRGDTLTGQDVIPSSGANGGLIYSNAAAAWTP